MATFVSFRLLDGSSARQEVGVPLDAIRTRHSEAVASRLAQLAAQEATNTAARAYLADTDWYAIRAGEGGPPIPPDIAAARAAARERVVDVDWTIDLAAIAAEQEGA